MRKRRAFTLLELLVVSGIISVLIAFLLVSFAKARASANRISCLNNIRQLGAGVLQYCQDNKGWFPTCACADDLTLCEPYPEDWVHWQTNRKLTDSAIARYVAGGNDPQTFAALLRCPADTFDARQPRPGNAPGQGPYEYSYNLNEAVGPNRRPYPARIAAYLVKVTGWRASSRKILLTEVFDQFNDQAMWNCLMPLTWRHGTTTGTGNLSKGSLHTIGNNVSACFIDGHAEGINDDLACDAAQDRASSDGP